MRLRLSAIYVALQRLCRMRVARRAGHTSSSIRRRSLCSTGSARGAAFSSSAIRFCSIVSLYSYEARTCSTCSDEEAWFCSHCKCTWMRRKSSAKRGLDSGISRARVMTTHGSSPCFTHACLTRSILRPAGTVRAHKSTHHAGAARLARTVRETRRRRLTLTLALLRLGCWS